MLVRNIHAFVIMVVKLGFLRPGLRIPAMILLGIFCGMGLLLAHISRTTSYLIDSPETCMNCHVMTDAYVSHAHSSHGRDTTCNDCHLPHTSFAQEYAFKAHDGLKHAAIFTLRMEPQVMCPSDLATPVVQENCVRCHEQRVAEMLPNSYPNGDQKCWDCHRGAVHGRVRSLAASPDVSRPPLPSVMSFPPLPPLFGKGNEKYEVPNGNDDADSE